MATRTSAADFPICGGHLALDFVNTLGGPLEGPPARKDEGLNHYEDLARWLRRLEVVSDDEAAALEHMASGHPRDAARALAKTRKLRELVYDVMRPLADGGEPEPEALERLRDREREALRHGRLEPDRSGMCWSWPLDSLEAPLWPLTHAAVELLTHGPLERLKVCAACRWLFLDESRNHSRRWCSMEECGVSIKKQRYVERRRARQR
jgi:predicted RNA-binding Zn ribbon-like protein